MIFADLWYLINLFTNDYAVLPTDKIAEFFFHIDEFPKEFNKTLESNTIVDGKIHRNKPCKMSESEVETIVALFHLGGYRHIKHFYLQHV